MGLLCLVIPSRVSLSILVTQRYSWPRKNEGFNSGPIDLDVLCGYLMNHMSGRLLPRR
jgi:hypothetical protein